MDLAIYRNRHFSRDDIVFGLGIVLSIEAEDILVGLTNQIWVKRTEFSIWPLRVIQPYRF